MKKRARNKDKEDSLQEIPVETKSTELDEQKESFSHYLKHIAAKRLTQK